MNVITILLLTQGFFVFAAFGFEKHWFWIMIYKKYGSVFAALVHESSSNMHIFSPNNHHHHLYFISSNAIPCTIIIYLDEIKRYVCWYI